MTDKELKKVREQLPKRTRMPWSNWTDEEKRIDRELSCREMINSILCYDGKENIIKDWYLQKYVDELGIETVQRLCDEQITDFEKAIVKKHVHTDSEGISYNSIIWADEQIST